MGPFVHKIWTGYVETAAQISSFVSPCAAFTSCGPEPTKYGGTGSLKTVEDLHLLCRVWRSKL